MVSLAHQTLLGKATRTRLLGALIRQIRCISQGHCTAWVVLVSSMIAKRTGSLAALVGILQQVDRRGKPWREAILRAKIPYPDSRCGCLAAWGPRRAGHPAVWDAYGANEKRRRGREVRGGARALTLQAACVSLFFPRLLLGCSRQPQRRDRTSTPLNPHSSPPRTIPYCTRPSDEETQTPWRQPNSSAPARAHCC